MPVALDAVVALVALGVLLQVLVPLPADAAGGPVDPLLTVVYPAVGAVLCAVGLVTVASGLRAAADGGGLAAAGLRLARGHDRVAGALAVAHPSPLLDAVATTAYLGMLAAATLALAADPGPRGAGRRRTARPVPLIGVVRQLLPGFGVLLLLLGGLAAGRPLGRGRGGHRRRAAWC